MQVRTRFLAAAGKLAASGLVLFALVVVTSPDALGQAWMSYAHDPQHTGQAGFGSQLPQNIRWQTPVDLAPVYSGGSLFTHYGSPLITSTNTVLVPVKTTSTGSFRLEARRGTDGTLLWRANTDYVLPHHNWIPPCGPTLIPGDSKVVMPAAGGTVLARNNPNSGHGNLTRQAFFGITNYQKNPAAFNAAIQICTPITSDGAGNLYFGYVSNGSSLPGYPNGIPSGLARISSSGSGSFAKASDISGDTSMVKVSYNCTPAVSSDGSTLYVAVNNVPVNNAGNFGQGYLCKLNSTSLALQAAAFLNDPRGYAANLTDDSTASPTIGPDGDVYFGVLEGHFPSNNDRGWMLHFSGDLSTTKTPGAFGWDNTASIVPATAVPSYTGGSTNLILTKYNNYAGVGSGNGHNKLAILDPNATETDPITGATVMNEVLTILGPTPDPLHSGGVREWCINSAAIDTGNKCAVVNSEDGHVYRWDFTTNMLSTAFPMATATGESYTPTLVGPDGAVYAINNAELYCCQANSTSFPSLPGTSPYPEFPPVGLMPDMIFDPFGAGEFPEKSKR
jgi:hypothetical protein